MSNRCQSRPSLTFSLPSQILCSEFSAAVAYEELVLSPFAVVLHQVSKTFWLAASLVLDLLGSKDRQTQVETLAVLVLVLAGFKT